MSAKKSIDRQRPTTTIPLWIVWGVVALLAGFALFARFHDLKADPPAFFGHGSQDLTTDGGYLTLHAKQAVLYGEWDLFGYKSWTPFKVSAVSWMSFVLFKFFGVSRVVANSTGAVLSLAGIFLFLFALWDRKRPRFVMLLALFLCSSYLLTIYGRVPFAEDGLFFLAGLTFLVFIKWFDSLAGKIAVGVLVALCGLLGKTFGFLLCAGPVIYLLGTERSNRFRHLAALLAPLVATFSLFWLIFYRDQGFFSFLWEHSTGVHGFPHGFDSPKGFFECLISYGRYGVHTYSSVVSILFYLAAVILVVGRWNSVRGNRTLLFMLGWFGAWVLIMSPFNYLPLRYFFLLFVPMAVVAASLLEELPSITIGGFGKPVWWRMGLLLILNWVLTYYITLPVLAPGRLVEEFFHAVWTTLPVAALLTAVMELTFSKKKFVFGARAGLVVLVLAVIGTAVTEGVEFGHWLREGIYTVEYANTDVAALVDPGAVIAGQYGPAISADEKIRNFPYFVTDDSVDVEKMFRQYPVTHVAVGERAWEAGIKNQPGFKDSHELTRFWVRDAVVVLVRVADVFGNGEAARYQLSDFEKASMAVSRHQVDSAEVFLKRFLAAHPVSRSGLANTFYWTLDTGPLIVQKPCVDRLTKNFPTDFSACILGGIYYKWLYATSHNPRDKSHSEELVERAVRLNPDNEESIRRMYSTYQPNEPVM